MGGGRDVRGQGKKDLYVEKKTKQRALLGVMLCCAGAVLWYGFFIEPHRIRVRHLDLSGEVHAPAMEGLVGVHISDLHMGRMGKRERRLLALMEEIKPDLLFLTGDYVKWRGDYGPALDFLSRLSAPMGVWAVLGDYDAGVSRKSCLFCHEAGTGKMTRKHGVRFVDKVLARLDTPGGGVAVGGYNISNALVSDGKDREGMGKEAFALILSHDPLLFDDIPPDRNVLILAGDTHGGQVPAPSWFWRILGYEKNARFNHGMFRQGKKRMYVTRGIGTSHIPFRLFCGPEVAVLHF